MGSTRLESLRLYPAIPHKTNDHYSHRPGPLRAPSLLSVTRLKAALIQADRRLVGQRPVSKLPRPEPEPEALETDEPKRKAIFWDMQRYASQKMYYIPSQVGAGTGFTAWQPTIKNADNFQTKQYGGGTETAPYHWKNA